MTKEKESKKEFYSFQEVFYDAAEIDPSKDEIIDFFENPEKLVGATGWKHLKIPDSKKTAYFYFKNGKLANSSKSFNKKFLKNLKSLCSVEDVKKIKNKQNILDIFREHSWESFVSNIKDTNITEDFLICFKEIGFDKKGSISSLFEEEGQLEYLADDNVGTIEYYVERIFEWPDATPFQEISVSHSDYLPEKYTKVGAPFHGKVNYTNDNYIKTEFLKHGSYHREDGPAVIKANGTLNYYLDGEYFSFKESYEDYLKEYKKKAAKISAARNKLKALKSKPKTENSVENTKSTEKSAEKMFDSFTTVPSDFTGTAKVDGFVCHFKNGRLHREDGPAIENNSPFCYAFEGVRLTKKEHENYKNFRNKYQSITKEWLKEKFGDDYKETNASLHPDSGVGSKVLIVDIKNKRYVFEPRFFDVKTKSFSEEMILTSVEIYNKTGLISSRERPAVENIVVGDLYYLDGIALNKQAWETALVLEQSAILANYELEFSYSKIKERIKNLPVFHSFDEYLKSDQKTGVVIVDINNLKTVSFIKNGEEQLFIDYRDEKLHRLTKLKNNKCHSDMGPAYFQFNQENPRVFYYKNGELVDQDMYCFENTSSVEHPKLYLDKVLSELIETTKVVDSTVSNVAEITAPGVVTKIVSVAKSDAKEVAKRMAANKISFIAQELLIQSINKSKSSKLDSLKNFLNSSKGKIVVKFASSLIVDALKVNLDPKYREVLTEISTEFRIQSETDLSIEVIDTIKDIVGNVDVLKRLSNLDEHVRVQLENFSPTIKSLPAVKEEVVELPEQKIPQFIN